MEATNTDKSAKSLRDLIEQIEKLETDKTITFKQEFVVNMLRENEYYHKLQLLLNGFFMQMGELVKVMPSPRMSEKEELTVATPDA